jgi:16S rRNA (guanine527-N7)-methyltransferase
MLLDRIAELLAPFVSTTDSALLAQLQSYLALLERWNAHMNLTAVRDPEQMVTRHFGESLFAARALFGDNAPPEVVTLADVGSGAGFPGIPIKLFAPSTVVTLIESQNKKATFLREAIRTLELSNAEVFQGRAEQWGRTANVVTLRAVEHFQQASRIAGSLVAPSGRICLLIGQTQIVPAQSSPDHAWHWSQPLPVPQSDGRVLLIGDRL